MTPTPPRSTEPDSPNEDYTSGYRVLPDLNIPGLLHLAITVPFAHTALCTGRMLQAVQHLRVPQSTPDIRLCNTCRVKAAVRYISASANTPGARVLIQQPPAPE